MFTEQKNTLMKQKSVLQTCFMWLFRENTTNQTNVDYLCLFGDDSEMVSTPDHLKIFGIIKFKG